MNRSSHPFPAGFRAPLLLLLALLFPTPGAAQVAREAVDLGVVARIRDEGLNRSHIPELARHLTEVIGPRLTGSPGMREANRWTAETLRGWGLVNVVVEPWGDFGRGWAQEDYFGRILTPFEQPLHGQPMAWTGSTPGLVKGAAVVVRAESEADLAAYRGRLRGTFLLVEDIQEVDPEFEHRARRSSLEDLLEPPPAREAGGPSEADIQAMRARMRAQRALSDAIYALAEAEGAHAVLRISSRNDGVIRGGSAGSREAGAPEGLPHVALSREQYNQIYRNVEAGVPVEMELRVENRF
ncbi:MAG: hypothetical protein OEZ37_08370, partial [Gemmatimonadota bacterium]|nr:hypothetical protein [Gemmatimonadota bacterium]